MNKDEKLTKCTNGFDLTENAHDECKKIAGKKCMTLKQVYRLAIEMYIKYYDTIGRLEFMEEIEDR